MVQDFLVAWVLWYYGSDPYPNALYDALSPEQRAEVIHKKEDIKRIIGLRGDDDV